MGWSNVWPVVRWDVPDEMDVFNNLVAALQERDDLVPADFVPVPFTRLDVIKGVPAGSGGPTGLQTVANFQYEIDRTLALSNPWRWWDRSRGQLYALADLLTDALGQDHWTYDLTAPGARWTPPFPVVFNELRLAINQMKHVRRLAASATSSQTDSVYNLTMGITNWPAQRAATFALFDGQDDGVSAGLIYDVGLAGIVFDSGSEEQWYVDAREMELRFDSSTLAGLVIARAWVEFNTTACPGSTDFSDTFTAELTNSGRTPRGSFDSDDYALHSFEVAVADINAAGDSIFYLRSQRPNSDDRPAWAPSGPDYSSTYREGFDLGEVARLIVEVEFAYHA